MKSNSIGIKELDQWSFCRCFYVIIGLMMFSMYCPYNHTIAIIYQIIALLLGIWMCKNNSCGIAFILILNVAREYIAISTMDSFNAYYSLNSGIMILFIIFQIVIKLYLKKWTIQSDINYIPISILGMQMLMSLLWADNFDEYNAYFPVVCIIYICGFLVLEKHDSDVIKIAFIISGFFMAIGVVPYYIGHSSLQELTVLINGNGLLVDRNYQSLFLMLCILNSITFLKEKGESLNSIIKMFVVSTVIADIFIIAVGASRSAILGLAIAMGIYIFSNTKSISKMTRLAIILLVFIYFSYNIGLLDPVLERFLENDVSSGNGRFDLWARYISAYEEGNLVQMLFGRGLIGKSIVGAPAHNMFVSILFSYGIIGECVFLIYCSSVLYNTLKINKNELIVLIPLLFMCFTLEPYYRIEFALYMTCIPFVLKSKERRI